MLALTRTQCRECMMTFSQLIEPILSNLPSLLHGKNTDFMAIIGVVTTCFKRDPYYVSFSWRHTALASVLSLHPNALLRKVFEPVMRKLA